MPIPTSEERKVIAKTAADTVRTWVAHAVPGAREPYYEGFLWVDRKENAEADETAKALWRCAERGQVMLTQQRVGDGHYIYFATRSGQVPKLRRVA